VENTVRHRAGHQSGERGVSLPEAFARAVSAVAELGMTFELMSHLDGSPGVWECALRKDGRDVASGRGFGKGAREAARTGAVFEALEHHLSGLAGLRDGAAALYPVAEVAQGTLARDVAVSLLAEAGGGPDQSIACWSFRSMAGAETLDVPVFLSTPQYLEDDGAQTRDRIGDRYDYTSVGRYSCNSGWAAGCDSVDAAVHALNEVIERDALSMLLIEQFISRQAPLRVLDPATLPTVPGDLLARAQDVTRGQVHIVDMTTDLGVPTAMAFQSPPAGEPARIRGCGTSLSQDYAIARALSELIQAHVLGEGAGEGPARYDQTVGYPTLHACRRADLTPMLADASMVAYADADVPDSPAGHRDRIVEILTEHGHTPYLREHYVTDDIAVVNVIVPGLERFMLIGDGILVVPGERGQAAGGRPTNTDSAQ
jgi:ribosomal protein S12 methylthiotransferase accessory factor